VEAALAELVLLAAGELADKPAYGSTKLNKVLFFSDMLHYKRHGTPISGAVYERLPRSPAPRGILAVRQALIDAGDASIEERGYLGHIQTRLVPVRPADAHRFPPTAQVMVAQVCEALAGHSHTAVLGWKLAEEREEIPYPSIFLSPAIPIREDITRALALAAERGLMQPGLPGGGQRRRPPAGAPRTLRRVTWECSPDALLASNPRGSEVLAGVEWACARWPEGVHGIPGTRLAMLRTEWPVPSLRVYLSLEDADRCSVWAIDQVAPYGPEEDGSE
jgi:hypothetical protein